MGLTSVVLPGGREAEIRPLTGEDEAWLRDSADAPTPAARATALLARCVVRVGSAGEWMERAVRELPVGDREALLLHARRLAFGDRLDITLACPACGERLDAEGRVSSLLVPPGPPRPEVHEAVLPWEGRELRVRFRLPTGADVEDAAPFARADPDGAAERLAAACVVEVVDASGAPVAFPGAALADALGAAMAELDPQAEVLLESACAACGHSFTALFDAASWLLKELDDRAARLYHDVHELALHYHWTEADVLALTARRRAFYLDLLRNGSAGGPP